MSEISDDIRQEMEVTKSQLSEKLESLENQVTQTVQSTGTAVNSTVEAVQVTVERVAEAVQDMVHSVSNAFDVRRQIEKHPLLVLGGATALGYLAADFFTRRRKKPMPTSETTSAPASSIEASRTQSEQLDAKSIAISTDSNNPGRSDSNWHEVQDLSIRAFIAVVRDLASHAIPLVMSRFNTGPSPDRQVPPKVVDDLNVVPHSDSIETTQHLRLVTPEPVRTGLSESRI